MLLKNVRLFVRLDRALPRRTSMAGSKPARVNIHVGDVHAYVSYLIRKCHPVCKPSTMPTTA